MSTTYGATGLGQTAASRRQRLQPLREHIGMHFRNGANARGYEPPCAT